MKQACVDTFGQLIATLEKDPEFVEAYRRQQPYYDLLVEIIRRRRQLKMTQEQLAERAGMPQSGIARLESAEHNARLSTLIKVAEALGARLEIRLVPNYPVNDDDYTRLLSVSISTQAGTTVSRPSRQVETNQPIRHWEVVNA